MKWNTACSTVHIHSAGGLPAGVNVSLCVPSHGVLLVMSWFDKVCFQVQNVPAVWPKHCSMCHMGKEMERNWMCTYRAPTLWVQNVWLTWAQLVVLLQMWGIADSLRDGEQVWLFSVSDVQLVVYLHGGYWQFLRYILILTSAFGFKSLLLVCSCWCFVFVK